MLDPVGLALTVAFVAAGLGVIPLDKSLERRRQRRRRYQARPQGGKR